jgi:hypothetical protein
MIEAREEQRIKAELNALNEKERREIMMERGETVP